MEITASKYQPNQLEFDAKDMALATVAIAARERRKGPRVGDFVIMPDNSVERFTHDWGDDIQTTGASRDVANHGGFFLYGCGGVSYSGGLDPAIMKDRLELLSETRAGLFWFFHHAWTKAHNAVYFNAPCRVYRVK